MSKTWVLVAHEGGARVFERRGIGKGLELIEEHDNAAGRQRDQDFDADRPGRSFRRNAGDARRSAMSREEGPRDRAVADFARMIANRLGSARNENQFARLVLVAPPKFLGTLRGALDAQTTRSVIASLDKDLAGLEGKELDDKVGEVLAV